MFIIHRYITNNCYSKQKRPIPGMFVVTDFDNTLICSFLSLESKIKQIICFQDIKLQNYFLDVWQSFLGLRMKA